MDMMGKKCIKLILSLLFILTSNKALLGMSCCSINTTPTASIPLTNVVSLAFNSNSCLVTSDTLSIVRVHTPLADCIYNPTPTVTFPAPSSPSSAIALSSMGCLAVANENDISIFLPSETCPGCDYSTTASTVIPNGGTAIGFSLSNCLALGKDNGQVFIYSSIDPVACIYNETATTTFSIPSAAHISNIAFSPINNCLAVGDINGNVYIYSRVSDCTYNTTTPQTIALGSAINDIAFSGSDCLAIADNSGRVTTYKPGVNCVSYTLATTISELVAPSSLAFSLNGCLAIGSSDGKVGIYSPTGSCAYSTSPLSTITSNVPVLAIAFSLNNCLAVPFAESVNIYAFNSALSVNIIPQDSNICVGGTVNLTATVSGGIGPFTYTWMNPSDTVIQTGPSNTLLLNNITAADMGFYSVIVQDAKGCTARAMAFVGIDTVAISLTNPSCSVSSSPSPTITGITSPNISVIIFANSAEIGRATSDALGQFSFEPQVPLTNGRYTIIATTATAPCVTTSNSIVIVVDTLRRNCLSLAIRNKYCPACAGIGL